MRRGRLSISANPVEVTIQYHQCLVMAMKMLIVKGMPVVFRVFFTEIYNRIAHMDWL